MPTRKPLSAALVAVFGMLISAVTFAGPANAADEEYPPPRTDDRVLGVIDTKVVDTKVVDTKVPAKVPAKVAGKTEAGGLAFTGANALGIGALGGLLLAGGGVMVFAGRRRKSDA